MKRQLARGLWLALMVGGSVGCRTSSERSRESAGGVQPSAALTRAEPTDLEFRELLDTGPRLRVSSRARALTGKRVRMTGYMARLELAARDGFYLTPRPTQCDEAGGGTADLPLESVRVIAMSTVQDRIAHVEGPLVVTGVFEVGSWSDSDGRVSKLRLLLDGESQESTLAAK